MAEAGQMKACKILAKQVVNTRKSRDRMYNSRAMMNNMSNQLTMQLSTIKVVGALQKSTEVLHTMNDIMKVGAMTKTMHELAREMEKAGELCGLKNSRIGLLRV